MHIRHLAPSLAVLILTACDAELPVSPSDSGNRQVADVDPQLHTAITRHLELLDLAGMPNRLLESMIQRMQTAPKLPEGLIDRVRAAAKAEPVQELLIRFVAARLAEGKINLRELEAINDFYASPVGRKYAAAQPTIVQGSSEFLQTWATQLSIKASDAALRISQDPGK